MAPQVAERVVREPHAKPKRIRLRYQTSSADVLAVTCKARDLSDRMLRTLVWVAENSDDHKARVAAANVILERAWGKVPQSIVAKGDNTAPLKVEVVYRKRDDDTPTALIDVTPDKPT